MYSAINKQSKHDVSYCCLQFLLSKTKALYLWTMQIIIGFILNLWPMKWDLGLIKKMLYESNETGWPEEKHYTSDSPLHIHLNHTISC